MATYYFSSSTGSDSTGDGSVGNPWANFRGKKNGVGALSPGDICLFKAGDIWYGLNAIVEVLSSGTSGNPIVLDRYGNLADNDPILCGASIVSSWTFHATSTDSGGGSIYKKASQPYCSSVGVDGTYALGKANEGKNSGNLKKGSFINSGGTLYINLADGGDANAHTIYIPTNKSGNWSDDYYGGVNIGHNHSTNTKSNGNYVEVNHLQSWYHDRVGFSTSGLSTRFNDCTAIGNAGDGFLFSNKAGGTAQYGRAYRCYASYNSAGGTGFGQTYTTRAGYTWFVDCIAENNFMAGFDFLNSQTSLNDDCEYSGMVYCTSYRNGQSQRNVNYDPGVYIDGGHDILIYGCHIHGAGIGDQLAYNSTTGAYSVRAVPCILVSTEHAAKPVYNVHVANNLIYDATSSCLQIRNGGDYPAYTNGPATYGNTVVNNTIIRSSNGGYGGAFRFTGLATNPRLIFKNNIVYSSNVYLPSIYGTVDSTKIDSSHNCYYRTSGTDIISTAESSPAWDLAGLQAAGMDADSIFANPNMQDVTFATLDAHLNTSTSPCINAGTSTPWTPPQWIADANILANDGAIVGSTRSDGVSDSGTLDIGYHYYTPTPSGSLTSTNVQPATLYVGTTNTCTISFTTANALPADGTIVVTFPTTLGGGFSFHSGGASSAAFTSGGDGTLAVSSVGSVLTLARSGGSEIAAATAVTISVTNVLNPPQVGSTGAYEIKTTTVAGTTIDIDSSVAADQIILPPSGTVVYNFQNVVITGIKFL